METKKKEFKKQKQQQGFILLFGRKERNLNGPIGEHKAEYHSHYMSPTRRRERERNRKLS